jgi:mycothiol synthase
MSESIFMYRPNLQGIPVPALPLGYTLEQLVNTKGAAELGQLLTQAFDENWDIERANKELLLAPDVHAVYVVMCQDKMVATASSQLRAHRSPTSGYVHWVGTHPDFRGQRLAYALVAKVLQDFVVRGYQDAYLETQPYRLPAIKTYLRLGFIPVYEFEGQDFQAVWSEIFQNLLRAEYRR